MINSVLIFLKVSKMAQIIIRISPVLIQEYALLALILYIEKYNPNLFSRKWAVIK